MTTEPEITARQLRAFLFFLQNQKMTIEDFRHMLFMVDKQDEVLVPDMGMWKRLEAEFEKVKEY